jgi:hypothetical protein
VAWNSVDYLTQRHGRHAESGKPLANDFARARCPARTSWSPARARGVDYARRAIPDGWRRPPRAWWTTPFPAAGAPVGAVGPQTLTLVPGMRAAGRQCRAAHLPGGHLTQSPTGRKHGAVPHAAGADRSSRGPDPASEVAPPSLSRRSGTQLPHARHCHRLWACAPSEVAPPLAAPAPSARSPGRYLWALLLAQLFASLPLAGNLVPRPADARSRPFREAQARPRLSRSSLDRPSGPRKPPNPCLTLAP